MGVYTKSAQRIGQSTACNNHHLIHLDNVEQLGIKEYLHQTGKTGKKTHFYFFRTQDPIDLFTLHPRHRCNELIVALQNDVGFVTYMCGPCPCSSGEIALGEIAPMTRRPVQIIYVNVAVPSHVTICSPAAVS